MTPTSIHRLVAVGVNVAIFVLSVVLWVSGGDGPRNPDYLVWTLLSLVATGVAAGAFAIGLGRTQRRADWALWAMPAAYLLAAIISALV
jgi:heme A synthase